MCHATPPRSSSSTAPEKPANNEVILCPWCKGKGGLPAGPKWMPCDLCRGKGMDTAATLRQRQEETDKEFSRFLNLAFACSAVVCAVGGYLLVDIVIKCSK